jgi:hypothetical protein
LQLPSLFIDEEIKCWDWNNIPIPLVDAVSSLKKAMINSENLFLLLCKESKNRSENTAKKFKQLERLTIQTSETLTKQS